MLRDKTREEYSTGIFPLLIGISSYSQDWIFARYFLAGSYPHLRAAFAGQLLVVEHVTVHYN